MAEWMSRNWRSETAELLAEFGIELPAGGLVVETDLRQGLDVVAKAPPMDGREQRALPISPRRRVICAAAF